MRKLGSHLEKKGQAEKASEGYQKALEVDSLAEEFYRRLMLCYDSQGRKADALATYERCRRTLQAALGIEPSEESQATYESLRSSSPNPASANFPTR